MDLPTSVDIDLGSPAWALGTCGVLALFIVCATCIILSVTSGGKAPEVLTAFADVIGACGRRPRGEGLAAGNEGEPAPKLDKAA